MTRTRIDPDPTALAPSRGGRVPGLRNVDHLAFTVPDLDRAQRFFGEVFGALPLYRQGPVRDETGDFMARQLNVHPRAQCHVALLRLGPHVNLELFEYSAPGQRTNQPANALPGGHHLAFQVGDLDAALSWLADRADVRLQGGAREPLGAGAAGRWAYLTTDWGMQLELVQPDQDRATPGRYTASDSAEAVSAGLPTLVGLDHVEYTVPDIDRTLEFLTGPLGGVLLSRESLVVEDADLAELLESGAAAVERAAVRLGPVTNVELRESGAPFRDQPRPRNSDVGGHHLAFYVEDVDAAADFLAATPGARVLGTPQTVDEGGPIDGDRWVYFEGPLGFQFEILTLPEHLPYERTTTARRFGPCASWDR